MGKYTIHSGKSVLNLKKSRKFVGIKTKKNKDFSKSNDVKKSVYKNLGGFQIVELNKDGESLDQKLDDVRRRRDVEVGTHVYVADGSKRPLIPTGEIYIVFQSNTNEEEQLLALDEFKLELIERRASNKIIAKVTKNSPNPIKVANLMEKASLVKMAEPDMDALLDHYADLIMPDDALLDHEWHLRNSGFVVDFDKRLKKGADAKVIDAWEKIGSLGSREIVVAVIDNGFDLTHPDLKDKVYKPYDLWTQSSNLEQGDPRFTHGTPCASVAVGASNGYGITGAAPNARFMPVSGTSFSARATEEMFDYCINNGADIISCSWGTTDSAFTLNPLKEEAIAKAAREGRNGKGCIVLYAVGNDDLDYVSFYSAHPDVIAVAASTSQDVHATYSNRGREVTLCAPSNGDWPITAARAWWDEGVSWETGEYRYWRDGQSRGDKYKHFGGTSSSCPLVAGICALVLSVNPELTAKQVKELLCRTADKIGSPADYDSNGHSRKYGHGRVNAARAVQEAMRLKDAGNVVTSEVEEHVGSGRGLFRFNVERQVSKGWGIQIGAFAEYGNVLIQAEKLQRTFSAPVVVNINELNGKTVYKVVVGAFSAKTEAKKLQGHMKELGVNGFLRNLKDLA